MNLKIKSRESITWNVCLEKKKKKIVYMENEGKGGWNENIFQNKRGIIGGGKMYQGLQL